jgi:phosphoribosyl 1,2-cyclic phosphodiesterase
MQQPPNGGLRRKEHEVSTDGLKALVQGHEQADHISGHRIAGRKVDEHVFSIGESLLKAAFDGSD